MLGLSQRQRPYVERLRRRYGDLFTMRLLGVGPLVAVGDPDLIKQVFTADPAVLVTGAMSPLRRILGEHSLLALDGDRHLAQRRLLLPSFKGDRVAAYESLIEQITRDELTTWPEGAPFPVAESMQRITLRAILEAVFGASGPELRTLERLMPPFTALGSSLAHLPMLQRDLAGRTRWGRFLRLRDQTYAVLDGLIDRARGDDDLDARTDVLAAMVQATHDDGTPMTNAEIRDQLVTLLAAGHETTAHTLSWAMERLSRNPVVVAALADEVDAGGRVLRDATIKEVQRQRPVIILAGRYTTQEYELGGFTLPPKTLIGACAALTHFDPRLFPDPYRFMPERFIGAAPGTYEWIPFGGGLRRCIGATFAHLEMDVVLRVILEEFAIQPTTAPDERWTFRGVAWSPAKGGVLTVKRRRSPVRKTPGGSRPATVTAPSSAR